MQLPLPVPQQLSCLALLRDGIQMERQGLSQHPMVMFIPIRGVRNGHGRTLGLYLMPGPQRASGLGAGDSG